jgi:D-alanine-D-alanine ligase
VKFRDKMVGVLMGGRSAGRDASLRSGRRVLRSLLDLGYSAAGIDLTDPRQVLDLRLEAAFVALRGGDGQDGTLQSLLELCEIPYTHSSALTSALCANRLMSKRIFAQVGVPTPRFVACSELEGGHMDLDRVRGRLQFPVRLQLVHAPIPSEGTLVRNERQFLELVPGLKQRRGALFAEEHIVGRDLVVGVLGEEVLPPLERQGGSVALALLEVRLEAAVRRVAHRAAEAVACRGAAQVHLRLDAAGIPWVTEIDTQPELVESSGFVVQAAAAGYRFDELTVRILEGASLKRERRPWLVEAQSLPAGPEARSLDAAG